MGQMKRASITVLFVKGIRQAAAFVVDQQKGHFIRAEIDSHRKNIGYDEFRFAGTRHTCHQTMRALPLFVQVEHKKLTARANTDRCCQTAGRVAVRPAFEKVQVLHLAYAEHLQKSEGLGQSITPRDRHQAGVGQFFHAGCVAFLIVSIQFKLLGC